MSASRELFESLRTLRLNPEPGKSPQQSLLTYCRETLAEIEAVHYDFKEKSRADTPDLEDSDQKNLAKAVSGFANGAGGVLIWGVEDRNLKPKPVTNVRRFVDSLLQMAHQVTAPAVPGIDGDCIPADGADDNGFGLIYVPESDRPPHRVLLNVSDGKKSIKDHYYIRVGSSFVVASHSQLEDMFGRRPRPHLVLNHTEIEPSQPGDADRKLKITLALRNDGRGIARYPFLSLEVDPPHGLCPFGIDGNGNFGLTRFESDYLPRGPYAGLNRYSKFGSQGGFVIHSGMSLAITKAVVSVTDDLLKDPSAEGDVRIRYAVAAEGIALTQGELSIHTSVLREAAEKAN